MKKIVYFLSIGTLVTAITFLGCKKKDNPAPQDCSTSTFPSTTGTATVQILNFLDTAGGFTVVNANVRDYITFAVQINKGNNRTQKLKVYQTDCANQLGTQITFDGQPNVAGDGTINLRNTDDAQIRQFTYIVPSGIPTIYLNFEINENGGAVTYNRVKINAAGSGIIDAWGNITLGGNSNLTYASRLSCATGQTYAACNAAANIDYIDITYAVNTTSLNSYLCSNPARFQTPVSLDSSTASCGDDGTLSTAGGKATYFRVHSASDFPVANDVTLAALTVSTSDNQYIQIPSTPVTIEFLTSSGKKGLIYVASGTLNDPNGSISTSIKVQRW